MTRQNGMMSIESSVPLIVDVLKRASFPRSVYTGWGVDESCGTVDPTRYLITWCDGSYVACPNSFNIMKSRYVRLLEFSH